jgi:hypothetical protein
MDERSYTKIVDLNRDTLTVSGSNILKKAMLGRYSAESSAAQNSAVFAEV